MLDVAVVGGGLSGLVTAYRLQKAGYSVQIFEASNRVGGVIESERTAGFLLEYGANSSLAKAPLIELVEELGLSDRLTFPQNTAKNRFIVTRNKGQNILSPVPYSASALLRTPIVSMQGKLRVLLEPLTSYISPAANRSDESVGSMISRHFGREVTDQVAAPLLGGIWAADINKLSCRSALAAIWNTEQSSKSLMLAGLRAATKKKKSKTKPLPKLLSFETGMQTLAETLLSSGLQPSLNLNTAVNCIVQDEGYYSLSLSRPQKGAQEERISARQVVLATPAKAAAGIIKGLSPALTKCIKEIPYAPLGILHLSVPKSAVEHPLDGFGFLVPPPLGLATLGAIFCSSLFENRAPSDSHLLSCFVGGARNPKLADVNRDSIQRQVTEEVSQLISASTAPVVVGKRYWKEAIPNYPLEHHQTQEMVDNFESQNPGILLLGNWRNGVSVSDRISKANDAAQKVISRLSELKQRQQKQA